MPRKGQRIQYATIAQRKNPKPSWFTPQDDALVHTRLMAYLSEHLEWMRVRGLSAYTVRERRIQLRRFVAWCAERGIDDPRMISRGVLERYQATLYHYRKADGQPLTLQTQLQCLLSIRGWFKWLVRERHVAANPAADLELPSPPKRLPRAILSVAEVQQLLVLADPDSPDVKAEHRAQALRDRALLETLYATGLRRFELARVGLYDVDVGRALLMVREGKGGRDRMVPLGERARQWLMRYADEARPALVGGQAAVLEALRAGQPVQALFVTDYGQAVSPEWVAAKVKRYLSLAEIDKPGATHLLRHACATHMLDGGADIRFIQAMLGHADLSTTQIYTHVAIDKLAAVHAATHPGAKVGVAPRQTCGAELVALLDVLDEEDID